MDIRDRLKKPMCLVMLVLGGLVIMQLIPYGRNHVNPPVLREPAWVNAGARQLVQRACFNCHSHETVWPWYAHVAPASWLVYRDVIEGRRHLNFSDWQEVRREGEHPPKIRKEVEEGEMPPLPYRLAHPEARLSDAEKRQLIDVITATIEATR